eukprot:Blabericola_migrator_1__6748@NODE_340_length_9604_cov_22_008284_g273_i0_p4_GENE_NODE_340_length_9604_cov_22_008284_g273_i0NODE_340_length_9604_cov_22_008284_g273_i0_p4_ORF_typecomplete_len101_score18_38_NODE_340_length_9604_cov_22_008284_g273_i075307832
MSLQHCPRCCQAPSHSGNMKAQLHNKIFGVSQKFWLVLENCLERLCDSSVAEDIKHKYHLLTEQLTDKSQRMNQPKEGDEPARVEELSPRGYWSWIKSNQ